MTQIKSPVTALKRAKAELVKRGWCRATLKDGRGRVCAHGALCYAPNVSHGARKKAWAVLEEAAPGGEVHYYNDYTATRRRDIERLFDRAIALAQERGYR